MASIGTRLYRGELGFDFIGKRKRWYIASGVFVAICFLSILLRGFNFGIEFSGGNSFQFPGSSQQLAQAEAAAQSTGVEVSTAQVVGANSILLRTPELDNATAAKVSEAVANAVGIDVNSVSNSAVSARWGGDITNKALQALIVFLVAVAVFIAIRFQPKMAVAALAALANDLVVAAGVYSLVGFEVTPSTVIGLLTILGFSLYDTVVVFDKVDENTRGILGGSRATYSEAANLAVNQTLMRSINTSLIALLPVAGLLFVGAGLLGAGTLKDLALVLFVGLATGTYSSIFLATPILCDLKEREPAYQALVKRVQARKASGRGVDDPAVTRGAARRPSTAAARRGGPPRGKQGATRPGAARAGTATAVKAPNLSKPAAAAPTAGKPTGKGGRAAAVAETTGTAGRSAKPSSGAPVASRTETAAGPGSPSVDGSGPAGRPSARRSARTRREPAAGSLAAGTDGPAPDSSEPISAELDDAELDDAELDDAELDDAELDETGPDGSGAAGQPARAARPAGPQRGATRPARKGGARRGNRPSGKRKR